MNINIPKLKADIGLLKSQWNNPLKPFKYLVYEDFLVPEIAEKILNEYPPVTQGEWNGTTYIHQKNKFSKTVFGQDHPFLQAIFDELNSSEVLSILSEITGINGLIGDDDLFGGGLHQSINGAFLNVHIDFNLHEKTKNHRRMNLIIYLNKDWKEDYNGYLELWDMKKKNRIEYLAPSFNRMVIFETNEISFHGHPKPLDTPNGISRKSLAVYYYTKERPEKEIAKEHNTVYVNTEGAKGGIKSLISGIKALKERILPK
jgi:Rps23 Pro-64 3,4-dihydroxylase Tpa1-like proline 4-hydroxylase